MCLRLQSSKRTGVHVLHAHVLLCEMIYVPHYFNLFMDKGIHIDEKAIPYKLEHFCVPKHYKGDLESIMLPHGVILDRVERLAHDIVNDHFRLMSPSLKPSLSVNTCGSSSQNIGLVVICILKGGQQYFADLVAAIKRINATLLDFSVPMALEFIRVKSYVNDQSSGKVEIQLTGNETWDDLKKRFRNKNLLIVEDIIDTGRTMTALLEALEVVQANSVKVTSLFLKRTPHSNGYVPDYVGFSIPDKFIVGYCLDYNEYFRDLDVSLPYSPYLMACSMFV